MKAFKLLLPTLCLLVQSSAFGGKEVERLLAEYSKIETVTCQIRRTKVGAAGKMKFLSRVYWTNKDQIHAEGIAPVKRRTIADGERLYQYVDGDPKGFSRPIANLSEQMTISLRLVPGTAMDHLLRLRGLEEKELPSTGETATRIGIQADNNYVVLSFDEQKRLIGIDFFKTPEMKTLNATYRYRDFLEAVPGAWIPLSHETTVENDKMSYKETVRVDRFIANKPIAQSLFISSSFFDKDIDFVDEFAKIFRK